MNDKSDTNLMKLDVSSRLLLQTSVRDSSSFSNYFAAIIGELSTVALIEDNHTIIEKLSILLRSFVFKLDSVNIIESSDKLYKIAKRLSTYNLEDGEDTDNNEMVDEDLGDWGNQNSDDNDADDNS